RLDFRTCLSAIQPRWPVVLAMAEFPHRLAIYALDQIRWRHHEHRRYGEKREQQQHILRIHLDYVLTEGWRAAYRNRLCNSGICAAPALAGHYLLPPPRKRPPKPHGRNRSARTPDGRRRRECRS